MEKQTKSEKTGLSEIFDSELLQKSQPLIQSYAQLMSYYKCAIMEIETKFNVLNEEFSLRYDRNPINSVKSRLKSPKSIIEKLERNGYPFNTENIENNINDIAGIRVVCSFQSDVYMLAEALLKQDDIKLVVEKDYIKNPKPNGYRSLHLIVTVPIFLASEKRLMKAEIQLRTIAMDSWASLEHQIKYKKDNLITPDMENDLLRCSQLSCELDKKMDMLRQQVNI